MTTFEFECWNTDENRWDREMVGEQDASNRFATHDQAVAELPRLAEVLGIDVEHLRVVEV